ncbi:AbrB/MazE/SpoVT family DNA-binding domain-containing protein [Candidatus Pacearchaeota archaeon]|nr:AbrB/MazE/SpoVT family DNA-binding domain-containing protein [Candidatus Pacearchaeota archaeon]
MEIIKVNQKGQIVIPRKIRLELGINNDSIIAIEKVKDAVVLKKIEDDLINQIERSLEDIKHGRIKEWKG